MHKTCHVILKLNIMEPTNSYAVKKLEQIEENGNAVHMYYSQKKLERYVNPKCNGTKFTEASKKI